MDEVVIEERQRQAGHEGVHPDRQARQLDGDAVLVDAVDAVAGDLAAQQRAGLDLDTVAEVAERIHGGVSQPAQLGGDSGHGVQRQPRGQACLDAVHRCHQEVGRAHGDVGAAEVEER